MSEGRIAPLDVLRGVTILGTFASNAWIFADPGGPAAVFSGAYFSSAGALETVLRFQAVIDPRRGSLLIERA